MTISLSQHNQSKAINLPKIHCGFTIVCIGLIFYLPFSVSCIKDWNIKIIVEYYNIFSNIHCWNKFTSRYLLTDIWGSQIPGGVCCPSNVCIGKMSFMQFATLDLLHTGFCDTITRTRRITMTITITHNIWIFVCPAGTMLHSTAHWYGEKVGDEWKQYAFF